MGRRARRREGPPRERPSTRSIGAGPRVVMLHGGPGLDHHLLLPLAEQLADAFEVWLPDLPGHGIFARGKPRLSDVVERVERWLLEHDPDAVVGHSLGALVARRVLRRERVRPRAVVLIAPPGGERARDPRRPSERNKGVEGLRAALVQEVEAQLGGAACERFVAAIEEAALTPIADHEALRRSISHALAQPTPRCRPGCPTLVLAGDADPVVTPHQAGTVARSTQGATLEVLRGVTHFPAASGDDGVATRIRAFLDDALQTRR